MTIAHYDFTLTAGQVTEITGINSTSKRNGLTVILNTDKQNNVAVMVGGPTVTQTSFGYHLDADETLNLAGFFDYTDRLYATCASGGAGTAILHVLVVGK